MLSAVSFSCPSESEKFHNVSLSHLAIQRRIKDTTENINKQLRQKAMEFSFYSLAIYETTDSTDTVQLLVFVRDIDDNFNAFEELAGMQSMQGRTTGKDICSKILY